MTALYQLCLCCTGSTDCPVPGLKAGGVSHTLNATLLYVLGVRVSHNSTATVLFVLAVRVRNGKLREPIRPLVFAGALAVTLGWRLQRRGRLHRGWTLRSHLKPLLPESARVRLHRGGRYMRGGYTGVRSFLRSPLATACRMRRRARAGKWSVGRSRLLGLGLGLRLGLGLGLG